MKENAWWSEEYGFFGKHYLEGDNSREGYLIGQERILDVPSGYGRHSIALAKKGFNITGVELNAVHLSEAIRNAEVAQVSPDFVKGNMIDISQREEFDAVINMFYSFGFFETDEENKRVLANFFNALKKGGKFLFHTDVNVPRVLAGKYKEDETRNLASGNTLRIIDKYNPRKKKLFGKSLHKGRIYRFV